MHAETEAWISKAERDYIGASALARNRSKKIAHLTSFAAQQSAEKYLKVFLVEHDVAFPKTHDLAKDLLPRCLNIDESFSVLEPHLEFLDPYAVQFWARRLLFSEHLKPSRELPLAVHTQIT